MLSLSRPPVLSTYCRMVSSRNGTRTYAVPHHSARRMSAIARSILNITNREPYWTQIPVWKNVEEAEFLNYDWQVSLYIYNSWFSSLSQKYLHVLGFEHRPGERKTRPVYIQRPPRGDCWWQRRTWIVTSPPYARYVCARCLGCHHSKSYVHSYHAAYNERHWLDETALWSR